MTSVTIGPEHGTLTLHTGVEGRAAKAGHALTISMTDWEAMATFDGAHPTTATLRSPLESLDVVKGEGGLKPLSDKDKRTVRDSALETLRAATYPDVTFTSTAITPTEAGYSVSGDLSIGGKSKLFTIEVKVTRTGGSATLEALVPVVQTEFGIKPYTGLMGGLKVRDRVDIALNVTVPDPA